MEGERRVLIGIDLDDDFTQVCVYENKSLNSVSLSKDPAKYRIPTMLCALADSADWLFGEEAAGKVASDTYYPVGGLVSKAENDEGVDIFGRFYPADILLERFFRRLFAQLKEKCGFNGIDGVVITVKHCRNMLRSNIMSGMELLGVAQTNVEVITHLESFMYYVVSQNYDIWINDVGLFDFDTDDFLFYRLSFGRKTKPVNVVADRTDLTGTINYKLLEAGDAAQLVSAFENAADMVLHKQIMSSLYFTGNGFESAWADESLKKMCNGRRIFRGQNLYVKGAGYAAVMLEKQRKEPGAQEYRFISDEVLASNICIRVYKDGGYEELPIADTGDRFSEIDKHIQVIMDKTNELDLIVHNVLKKDFICAIMTLETLRLRDDRSTKVDIRVRFPKRDVCVITVRDMGFGGIYATDHKIWEQVLKL